MLSSVLRSGRAVAVNIEIMRAFVRLRGMLGSQEALKRELGALRRGYKDHDEKIKAIFMLIDELAMPPVKEIKKRRIGFLRDEEE